MDIRFGKVTQLHIIDAQTRGPVDLEMSKLVIKQVKRRLRAGSEFKKKNLAHFWYEDQIYVLQDEPGGKKDAKDYRRQMKGVFQTGDGDRVKRSFAQRGGKTEHTIEVDATDDALRITGLNINA